MKIYRQQGAILNDPDQNVEFIIAENKNYHQLSNAYLHFDITVSKADNTNFANADVIRVINNALAYTFKEAKLATTGGLDLEHNNYVGQISTIKKPLTSKDGDLSSPFDKINENIIAKTSLKQILINNHKMDANKGKIKGYLELEHIIGFCKTFENITKNLGIHITFKTADLQYIIYTTIRDAINITFNILCLYVAVIIPSA